MTDKVQKTNKVKEFWGNLSWGIKQLSHKINAFFEKHLKFLTNWPHWLKAIFYLAPALIIIGIFTLFPIVNSFLLSFVRGYSFDDGLWDSYTLWGNFQMVLSQSDFAQTVLNTVYIVAFTVPTTIIIALVIAVALVSIKPLKGLYQSIFFLPYVTNTIAIGLIFAFMFRGTTNSLYPLGLANQLIVFFGGEPIPWVAAGATYWSALTVIIVYTVWNGLAFKIIVFMAGIQGIDKQYYQAAQIDGASRFKTFRKITVPMISPMIFYILITSVIGAFKTYTSIVAIVNPTGVIPNGADGSINLKTIVFFVYDYLGIARVGGDYSVISYAAAAAIILFLIIMVFTVIQLQVGKRRVHY